MACNLADMCWHEHSDMRGDLAARRVLGLPVNCITHKERIWLATVLYHRYVGPNVAVIKHRRQPDTFLMGYAIHWQTKHPPCGKITTHIAVFVPTHISKITRHINQPRKSRFTAVNLDLRG